MNAVKARACTGKRDPDRAARMPWARTAAGHNECGDEALRFERLEGRLVGCDSDVDVSSIHAKGTGSIHAITAWSRVP